MPSFCRTELRKAAQHPETTDTGFFMRKDEIRILKRKKYQKKITSGINFADRVDED